MTKSLAAKDANPRRKRKACEWGQVLPFAGKRQDLTPFVPLRLRQGALSGTRYLGRCGLRHLIAIGSHAGSAAERHRGSHPHKKRGAPAPPLGAHLGRLTWDDFGVALPLRQAAGVVANVRLKARLNAASES